MSFRKIFLSAAFVFAAVFAVAPLAHAAITEQAPPIDGFFENNPTVGGGAIIPLVQFRLAQSSGSDTVSQIGFQIFASTTISQGEISRVSLWKESGNSPGFQLDQDTFVTGAASTSPYLATSTQILLTLGTALDPTSSGTQFYIIATTTAVSSITNGHAFNVNLGSYYASTTGLLGVGTAFLSNKKVTLNQSGTLKISEVKTGTATGAANEFVELYNSGAVDINLSDLPLSVHSFYTTGSSTPAIALTYYKKVIPSHGYFLIANQIGYSGSAPPDAVFATSTFSLLLSHGGLSIATSSSGAMATSTAIDFVGWGDQPTGNCESLLCAANLAEDGTSIERVAVGYPTATSTAPTMAQGGADSTKGNGYDSNNNTNDFVAQSNPYSQNSLSPSEFPFGGGGQDTSTLQVQGSYPGNNMTGVPIDTKYIGFGFNKPVASGSIASATATTTVTLFKVANNGPTGSNLCGSVIYNPMPGSFEPPVRCNISSTLEANASYVFTVTKGVIDLSGNALDQDAFSSGSQFYIATSTTGTAGQTFTNVVPPSVIGTAPFNGSQNIPSNLASMVVEFSADMKVSTLVLNSTITLANSAGTAVTLSSASFATSTGKNVLTFVPATLAANTTYTLVITGGVQSANNIPLSGAFSSKFTTGSSADTTAPTVVGVLPTNGTTIAANTSDFIVIFDDAMDGSTATSGAITLGITSGPNLPGTVRYDSVAKEVHFVPNNILPVSTGLTLTLVGGSLKNSSGVKLGNNVTKTWTVEASNADTTGPTVLYANADEFTVAVTFGEAVNATDATTLSNYGVTLGGVAQTLSALAGHTLTYDASTRTAKLSGLRLTSGAALTVSVSNIKDISGNIQTATANTSATVSSSTGSGGTGGFVGPGSFSGSTFGAQTNFTSSGIGFMPPVNIRPSGTFISASSTYAFELPIAKQIDAGGTIVITFPSSSDFGLCCVATTSSKNPFLSQINADINGFSDGTIGIKTITKNTTAKTVTITLDTATRSSGGDTHDFLKFSLADLVNPSIPKGPDSSGYSLDIKSKNAAGTLLESFSANPIYIGGGTAGGGAVTTIRGTVSGNGGNLGGATIHLMSPSTGPLDTTTDTNGLYQFANIPVNSQFLTNNFGGGGESMLFTDPFISGVTDANGATTTNFFGNTMPTPVQATSTSLITRNFSLTPTSSGINFTVKLIAAANTFTASETVDVFVGGPGQFVVRTVTPGTSALDGSATLTTMSIPKTNGSWGLGIGPAMPKGNSGGFSGPPPAPNWAMPKTIEVVVSGCPTACTTKIAGATATSNTFTISTADKTIAGVLKDGSGNSISNAMVYAFAPSTASGGGSGSTAQTSTSGAFSIKVVSGSYVIGAFSPGVGESKKVNVVVDTSGNVYVDGSPTASTGSSGANPFTLKMVKPGYTITGQVTDGTNAVGNAPVFAYRTDAPGRADAMSDSSTGNYTIYVDNGTWKVNSFIPGFGPMSEQTVTISSASQSGINFAPSSSQTFSIYSGNIYEDADSNNIFATSSEGVVGAVIRLSGTNGVNEGVSGAEGAFSIRVPSGTGYSITGIYSPSYGKIAALDSAGTAIGTLNLTASSTNKYIRIPVRNTVTVTVKDYDGNPLVTSKAFIDLFDKTTGLGNHVEISNASTTSLLIASSTSASIRAYVQGVPPANISVASDSAQTFVTSGVLSVSHATEAIKIVVNTSSAAMSNIVGTVYKTAATAGNELDGAWIQFVDQTNGVQFGTQATSTGGYSIKAVNGTYQVLVSKPQYVAEPVTVTVSGTTTKNFIMTASSLTISGTVTTVKNGVSTVAANTFVRAEKIGGGQAVTQTDTSGAYTLNVTPGTWKVFAAADGYSEGAAAANPFAVTTSQSGITVALSTTVSLQTKLATSNTFTDTSAGSFNDSTVKTKVNLDANAFGSAGNSSYITAKETSNYPNTNSVNIVANKAKDISAYSGGSQVTDLQSGKKADIELTYTKAELALSSVTTTTGVGKLSVVSYSDDKKDWETLSTVPTYLDSDGNALSSPSADLSNVASVSFAAQGTHFSAYALSSPEGVSPPDTPGSVTATGGSGQVALSWASSSGADGYYVYRNTDPGITFPLLTDAGAVTSYTNTGLSAGTTYYYKVSAYKSSGAESAASSAASAAPTATAASSGGSPGGGGGGGTGLNFVPIGGAKKPEAPKAPNNQTAAAPSSSSGSGSTVQYRFSQSLKLGASGKEVTALQNILEARGFLVIPKGVVKGSFGPATRAALMKYQKSVGLEAVGSVGKATKARLEAEKVFVPAPAAPKAPEVPQKSETSAAPAVQSSGVSFSRPLTVGSRGTDVTALQNILEARGFLVIPKGVVKGSFGPATKAALMKYQKSQGLEAIGAVGPATRKLLNNASEPSAAPSASADTSREAVNKQIDDTLKKIEELQKQIKTMQ